MAARNGVSTKTFRATVRNKSVPHILIGKRMRFDPFEVEAYLRTTEQPEKSNVIVMPTRRKRKTAVVSKRFAEAL